MDVINDATVSDGNVVDTPAAADTVATPSPVENKDSLNEILSKSFDEMSKPAPAKEAPAAAAATEAPALKDGQVLDPVTGRVLEPIKAPSSVPASLREKWNGIPREFQQYWADRERDLGKTLTETGEARKLAKDFTDTVRPFEGILKEHNITAVDHAKELFTLSHKLHTESPQNKAHIFFQLLQQFQPDAPTLKALLSGQHAPMTAPPQQPVDIDAEVEKRLSQRGEQEQGQLIENAITAFSSDPKNEFYADVKDTMANILAAGLVSDGPIEQLFKEAYDLACQRHPEVSKVLAARAGASGGQQQQAAPAAAAPAAKPVPSVKNSPGAGTRTAPPKKNMSHQEAAEWAWKQLGYDD